jgi:hypothetical protein
MAGVHAGTGLAGGWGYLHPPARTTVAHPGPIRTPFALFSRPGDTISQNIDINSPQFHHFTSENDDRI